ncbi:unnamed protein product [Clavelina lepadiformis]|uniref:BTB domain-containing protein n=1 Tax=Clavelina lepadiformis TaxID=159417 RepID=A0ABP0G1Q6_CLALP
MFTTKMEESYSNEGSVKEVSGPTMESIINFIYTSCIILTHDNVYDVLEAAEYLRITSLPFTILTAGTAYSIKHPIIEMKLVHNAYWCMKVTPVLA